MSQIDDKALLADSLTAYVKEGHTQEECVGFIAGFEEALKQINAITTKCVHNTVEVNGDLFGNTHYCTKCGEWNY